MRRDRGGGREGGMRDRYVAQHTVKIKAPPPAPGLITPPTHSVYCPTPNWFLLGDPRAGCTTAGRSLARYALYSGALYDTCSRSIKSRCIDCDPMDLWTTVLTMMSWGSHDLRTTSLWCKRQCSRSWNIDFKVRYLDRLFQLFTRKCSTIDIFVEWIDRTILRLKGPPTWNSALRTAFVNLSWFIDRSVRYMLSRVLKSHTFLIVKLLPS